MKDNSDIMLILIGIVVLTVFLPQESSAEFSYGDKIEFTVIIEEIKGHLVAAAQNHIEDNEELASLHLSHPLEENKAQLDALLKQQHTSENTELVLFMIQNIDTNLANDTFVESTQAADKLLDAIKKSVLGTQNDPIFQLLVINHLLESSKLEYETGRADTSSLEGILEVQDSHAFAIRANQLFLQIDGITTQDKDDVDIMFVQLFEKYKREESVSSVVESTNQIIDKINEIINGLDSDKSYDKKIPEWIQARVIWWTEDVIDDKTFALGIEFLIEKNVIEILNPEYSDVEIEETKIPVWVKNLSKWWIGGSISDDEFLNGMVFLVERGIIMVDRTVSANAISADGLEY